MAAENDQATVPISNRLKLQLAAAVAAHRTATRPDLRPNHRGGQPVRPPPMQPGQPPRLFQLDFAVGAHPAVIPHFLKPAGQDVLAKTSHELRASRMTRDPMSLAARFDSISHPVVINGLDSVVTDGNAVDIGCQVFEHRLPTTDRLDIDYPLLVQHARRQLPIQTCLADRLDEQFFVQHSGWTRMKQLVFVHLQPPLAITTHSAAGNDEVNVGMISPQVAAPGVQGAKETKLVAAQILFVSQQPPNRLTAGVEDRLVAILLVAAQERTEFLGNRKSHDKMLHRQQSLGLPGQPL